MTASAQDRGPAAEPCDAVRFDGIVKGFSGVPVLKGVSFGVAAGKVAGLVGENGAGKSTLMNLLGGNLRPDAGTIRLGSRSYTPRGPDDARAAGIAFVHQELNLFPNLSIAENLFLRDFPRRPGRLPWIDRGALRAKSADLLLQVGLDRDPATPVERLPAGERQLVEIAKALGADARVILFDEPTTSLSSVERERLFALVAKLRDRGIAMVYISHALGDVLRLCDDVVVLRDGEVVGAGAATSFDHDRLVSLMVGRQLTQLYPERLPRTHDAVVTGPIRGPVLEVDGVSRPGIVRDISFQLAEGEVLGISGLMGAGRSELARILFGLDPHSTGEIRLGGEPLEGPPGERIRRGLAFLTEDRRGEGLCMEASITDNMALATLRSHARTPARWLDTRAVERVVGLMRDAVRLSAKAKGADAVRTLSGGNQQKVVLGKWLLAAPKVLMLDEPTRGIDIGAKSEIYQMVHRLADRGTGVLVISSELEELIGICDRVLVMRHGTITGEFRRGGFDREKMLAAALVAPKP